MSNRDAQSDWRLTVVAGREHVPLIDKPLPAGGGGGTYDGMEPRIAKLEASMEYVQRDIGRLQANVEAIQNDIGGKDGVRDRLTRIEARMATKGFTVTVVLTALAVIAGLVIFQGNLQRMVGAAPVGASHNTTQIAPSINR